MGKSFSPEPWVISATHYYTWLSYFWGKHSLKVDDSANYKLIDRDIFYYLSTCRGIATYTMYSGSGLGRQNLVNHSFQSQMPECLSHMSHVTKQKCRNTIHGLQTQALQSLPKAENKRMSNGSIAKIYNEEINEEWRWKTFFLKCMS